MNITFNDAIEATMEELALACTRCGKCFTACPMVPAIGLAAEPPEQVLSGVVDLLQGGAGSPAAERWVTACSSSGYCVDACDYGVDPSLLVKLANYSRVRRKDGVQSRRNGIDAFRAMAKTLRVVARLQMSEDELARLHPPVAKTTPAIAPDLVLYTGCNVAKTPHILVLCLEVLTAAGLKYDVVGGPSACCGIAQFRAGDAENSGRAGLSTLEQIAAKRAVENVSWCPSCQSQFDHVVGPTHRRMTGEQFELTPFFVFLAKHIDRLTPHFERRVPKRVALNERPGYPEVVSAVELILSKIPGLELVNLDVPRAGLMSNYLTVTPKLKEELREAEFRAARDAGVTTLATIFHACHRELCHYEKDWEFEIVNVMEIIGESMGLHAEDIYKRLKLMDDVDRMIEDRRAMIDMHKLDEADVRRLLVSDQLAKRPVQGVILNE